MWWYLFFDSYSFFRQMITLLEGRRIEQKDIWFY